MTTAHGVIVVLMIAVVGAAPFVAVCRGARAFDDEPPEPETCTDDTIELPRVRAQRDPHMY